MTLRNNIKLTNDFFYFLFLYKSFILSCLPFFHNSQKLIIKLRYGLYHYFFWLKVGCKNISWRSAFTVYFLLDFMFSSFTAVKVYSYIITSLNYNILPIRKNVFTLSKGPMVRKKQSREQFMFKQIFFNVTKVIQFENSKRQLTEKKKINKYFTLNDVENNYLRVGQVFNFSKFLDKKLINLLFYFLNFNINYFIFWIKNVKNSNIFIETNLFFLKKIDLLVKFHDMFFFNIMFLYVRYWLINNDNILYSTLYYFFI